MSNDSGFSGEDVINIIRQFIINNFILEEKKDNIDVNISLYETRIVDSTGVLEIVDFLEERFGIKINDDELLPDNLDSIKKMSIFILRKMGNVS